MGSLKDLVLGGVEAALGEGGATSYVVRQVQKGKNELSKALVNEVKKFLDKVDLQKELKKALEGIVFEVEAKIRMTHASGKKSKVTTRKFKISR